MSWLGVMLEWFRRDPVPPAPAQAALSDARLRALRAHQDRVISDLAGALTSEERQQLMHMMDDRRYREAGHDG